MGQCLSREKWNLSTCSHLHVRTAFEPEDARVAGLIDMPQLRNAYGGIHGQLVQQRHGHFDLDGKIGRRHVLQVVVTGLTDAADVAQVVGLVSLETFTERGPLVRRLP